MCDHPVVTNGGRGMNDQHDGDDRPDDWARTAYELTENIPVGTYTMVLKPGEDLARFAFMSKRFLEMCDLQREGTDSDPLKLFQLIHPDDRARWLALNQRAFAEKAPFNAETRVIVQGQLRWLKAESVPRELVTGETVWEGVLIDVTDRKLAEQAMREAQDHAETVNRRLAQAVRELERLASTDFLTGTVNRRQFEKLVEAEVVRSRRYGNRLSQILLDVDRFKSINDRFGHAQGDRVLVELSRLLEANLREVDVLARWGGEEFVILLPQCDLEQAAAVAEKLRACLDAHRIDGVGRVTASFGVAEHADGESLGQWLQRVDRALYAAKCAGRNTVRCDQSSSADMHS